MKIQYIIHADFELPAVIETWGKEKGFNQKTCRVFAGEKIPDPNEFDWLILMGGPQSTLKMEEAPYLKEEVKLIQETVKAGIPIFGFCLGAQLIGTALGGQTEISSHKEIGTFPIELTDAGKMDPLLTGLPDKFPVMHWHGEMPGLTQQAEILAYSQGCPRQIIRYAPQVYGFQCHLEPTKKDVEGMILHCAEDLQPGKYIQSSTELLNGDYLSLNKVMRQILDNFAISLNLN